MQQEHVNVNMVILMMVLIGPAFYALLYLLGVNIANMIIQQGEILALQGLRV